MKTCACGVAISDRALRCARCRCRLAQSRYERTPKGRAKIRQYRRSDRGRTLNQQRIYVGEQYYGRVPDVPTADRINRHIKERRLAAKQRFAHREEIEGAQARGISPEAAV